MKATRNKPVYWYDRRIEELEAQRDALAAALRRCVYHMEGEEWLDVQAIARAALAELVKPG